MALFWQDDFETTGPNMGGGDRIAAAHVNMDDGSGPDIGGINDYFYRTSLASDVGNGLNAVFTGFT